MRQWFPLLVIVSGYLISAVVYPHLPERVPIHWTLMGEADHWIDRNRGAFLLPTVMLVNWLVFDLPLLREEGWVAGSKRVHAVVTNGSALFLFLLHIAVLRFALGSAMPFQAIVSIPLGLLFIALGLALPHARRNWVFGVRTPWTLGDARVWERTQRLGGQLYAAAGLATILGGILLPDWSLYVMMVAFVGASLLVIAYSYTLWRRGSRR